MLEMESTSWPRGHQKWSKMAGGISFRCHRGDTCCNGSVYIGDRKWASVYRRITEATSCMLKRKKNHLQISVRQQHQKINTTVFLEPAQKTDFWRLVYDYRQSRHLVGNSFSSHFSRPSEKLRCNWRQRTTDDERRRVLVLSHGLL